MTYSVRADRFSVENQLNNYLLGDIGDQSHDPSVPMFIHILWIERLMARKKKPINGYRYVSCRGPIRHHWDAVGPVPGRRRRTTFGTEATFRCENCGTIKIYILSRLTGDLISSPQYIHPDDYKTEQHDAAYWRAEWMDAISNDLMLDLEDQ